MTRGEVYFVNLDPIIGHEQHGRRPVLVVSNDVLNALPLVVAVVPGTDASNVRRLHRSHILVPATESGLPLDTVFLCHQVRALDHSRFPMRPAGHLSPGRMADIENALRYVLGL
jgi:mRNA interferase MazF